MKRPGICPAVSATCDYDQRLFAGFLAGLGAGRRSTIVVLGCDLAYASVTYRPLTALRPCSTVFFVVLMKLLLMGMIHF
jgi:hypothetical protein